MATKANKKKLKKPVNKKPGKPGSKAKPIKTKAKSSAPKVKAVTKKAKTAAKKTKLVKKTTTSKAKKNVKKPTVKKSPTKAIHKKIAVKKKAAPKKTKANVVKKSVTKKITSKKPIVKKDAKAKKAIVNKPVAKTVKVATKPAAKITSKTAELIKKPTVQAISSKSYKSTKPIKKGPPVAIPAMNHKTIAEKIEERKAAPMKLVASQINIGVVGPVPSIAPYRISPGEEYMNDKQKQHFLNVLQAWKQQLMEDVDKTVSHLKDDAENYADLNDRATQEEEFNLELRTRDRERKLLKKIAETITLIENGDFGYCEACGVEIGLPRLEVRPTATQCIDCKTVEEIREKQLTL